MNATSTIARSAACMPLALGSCVGNPAESEQQRAWFYLVLRNAIIDRHRRSTTAGARLQALVDELQRAESQRAAEADRELWSCIGRLINSLPPDQATGLAPHRAGRCRGQGLRCRSTARREQRGRARVQGAQGAARASDEGLRNVC